MGYNQNGTISNAYSSGFINVGGGSTDVGGLVGTNVGTTTINNSFFDMLNTSGITSPSGGVGSGSSLGVMGEATSALLNESTYTTTGNNGPAWNIGTDPTTNTWVILNGQTRPMLAMEYSTTITNAHQLQLIGLNTTTLGASYTLANNIDLNAITNPSEVWGTSTSNGGGGFFPLGTDSPYFSGTFNGLGHTINDLYINLPGTANVGLFVETLSPAIIENVGVTNLQVNGSLNVGGLVGQNGGAISNAYTTGAVIDNTGQNTVGGLVGYNFPGTITNSHSTASVTAGGSFFVGGLVGDNGGAITNSYSTGTVNGGFDVGGLVGANIVGSIDGSYSTEVVITGNGAQQFVGGLAGVNQSSTISNSHVTGSVLAGEGSFDIGGLVGMNSSGAISNSYSTGAVTAGNASEQVGGLVGYKRRLTISNSYSTSAVNAGSESFNVGGLVGNNNDTTISNSYSTGPVIAIGSTNVGGLVGTNNAGSTIINASSTGAVTAGGQSFNVGGLVGENIATINNSYSSGTVTAASGSFYIGGLVGWNQSSGTIFQSYSAGAVTGGTIITAGGLVGENDGAISNVYSTGAITACRR